MKKQQKKKTKKKKKKKKKIDYGYKVRETHKLHIYLCIESLIDFNCNLEKCMWSIPSQ